MRILLVGGTSHTGKSTVARAIADRLGWAYVTTDRLGRHPGRPWRTDGPLPEHVVAHYRSLGAEELVVAQLRHYGWDPVADAPVGGMWPRVAETVAAAEGGLVLEGSGVWPDLAVRLTGPDIAAVWLTAAPETLRARIHAESAYATRPPHEQSLITAFTDRTILYDTLMRTSLTRLARAPLPTDKTTPDGRPPTAPAPTAPDGR
ncbi:MAG TPA: hypothetical protein VGL93_12510, partial [Streptosporangiaceae bacterium]